LAAQQRAAQQAASAANAAGGSALGSYALGQMVDIASFDVGSLWGELPAANYIHNEVVSHIKEIHHPKDIEINVHIKYNVDRTKSGTGFMDLYRDSSREVWEVKPKSYETGYKHSSAISQLNSYIRALNLNEPNSSKGDAHAGGSRIRSHPDAFPDKTGKYLITYKNNGDGLILYDFKENKRNYREILLGRDICVEWKDKNSEDIKNNVIKFPSGQKQEQQVAASIPLGETILFGAELLLLKAPLAAFFNNSKILTAKTEDVAAGAAVVAGGVGLVVLVLDDATVVGILDDIAIAPLATLFGWGVSALVK
jgi:hypothetical protein